MNTYIEVQDGQMINHPILEENLIHLGLDLDNLPSKYVKIVKEDVTELTKLLTPYQKIEFFRDYKPDLNLVFEYPLVVEVSPTEREAIDYMLANPLPAQVNG